MAPHSSGWIFRAVHLEVLVGMCLVEPRGTFVQHVTPGVSRRC